MTLKDAGPTSKSHESGKKAEKYRFSASHLPDRRWGDRRKNQGFGELSTFHIGTTAFPRGWDQLDWKDRLGLDFGVCHACDSTCWPLLPATQAWGRGSSSGPHAL